MTTRIAVDIGGTFSDLIYFDDATGQVGVAKGSSTPSAPHEAVERVIATGVPGHVVADAELFLHGSTVALNALLERKGATVGLLATAGFRDVLEIRRGEREAVNDVMWSAPPPLVPRRRRLEVRERVLADGSVEQPLVVADVEDALRAFEEEGVDVVAVAFLNAYANPVHELAAGAALRASGFEGAIVLSHLVSGEYREYERTSTTVVDAYIRPRMASYLTSLASALGRAGFGGSCLITTSGGGALPFDQAESRPFQTIMSGPVAGAVGAGHVCRRLGIDLAVTADVGGTSFDTCLVVEGRPRVRYEGTVIGMPLQTPWVDVHSIGAGGGSIATFDAGGLLRVGPQSAGASPGPACYGRGGALATVTDAACVLGMLGGGELADGLTLDVAAATRVLEPLADRLGESVDAAAAGVVTIAAANMANAIREVTLKQGVDPRDATLFAFGGAGPLFCSHLTAELDMERVLVPAHAGNFSAWGLLVQDIAQAGSATFVHALDADGMARAEEILDGLADRLRAELEPTAGAVVVDHAADLRFVGQEYALTTTAPAPDTFARRDVDALRAAFVADYHQTFGHVPDAPLEFVSVRATLRIELPRLEAGAVPSPAPDATPATTLQAYSFASGARVPFAIVDRAALPARGVARGPAIVLEPTATTYVDAGYAIAIEADGSLVLTRERT